MNTKMQRIVFFVEVDERQIWYMKDCEIISVGRDADLLEECLNVRRAVFQVEKGIPRDIDIDGEWIFDVDDIPEEVKKMWMK